MIGLKKWISGGLVVILLVTTLLSLFPSPSLADNSIPVPFFMQVDKRWKDDRMFPSWTTLEKSGCLVTSISMVLKYYGVNTNPKEFNDYLSKNRGYDSEGGLVSWTMPATYSQGKVQFIGRPEFPSGQNASSSQLLKKEIDAGYPVIVRVRANYDHWVVVTGRKGNRFFINDPLGGSRKDLGYYGNKIYNIGIYHPTQLTTPSPPPSQKPVPVKNATVALIIDDSGSMTFNDRENKRKEAAKLVVDLLSVGDKITVVSFGNDAYLTLPLTTIDSSPEKEKIKRAIDEKVYTHTGEDTNFDPAFKKAYQEMLKDKSENPKAAIFMSDGRHQLPGDEAGNFYQGSHKLFHEKGWKIYSILLRGELPSYLAGDIRFIPNIPRLQEIGNGGYFEAPSPEALRKIYQGISEKIQGSQVLLDESFRMKTGEFITKAVEVPRKTTFLTFLISWISLLPMPPMIIPIKFVKSNFEDSRMIIITPEGKEITPQDPSLEYHTKQSDYEIYQIKDPPAGTWQIKTATSRHHLTDDEVNLHFLAKIDEQPPEILPIKPLPGEYVKGPLNINVEASDNIETSKVEFYFKKGKEWRKIGEDKKPQDGFKTLWKMRKSGSYEIKVVATDTVGNSASVTVPIILDNDRPKISKIKIKSSPFFVLLWKNEIKFSYKVQDTYSPPETSVIVKNSQGKKIKTLKFQAPYPQLNHEVKLTWDGRDKKGKVVPAGTYEFTITAQDQLGNQKKIQTNPILYFTLASFLKWLKNLF